MMVPANSDYTSPPQGYAVMSAHAGVDFIIKGKQVITVEIIANNLLNTSYRDYLNRFRYFSDDNFTKY